MNIDELDLYLSNVHYPLEWQLPHDSDKRRELFFSYMKVKTALNEYKKIMHTLPPSINKPTQENI